MVESKWFSVPSTWKSRHTGSSLVVPPIITDCVSPSPERKVLRGFLVTVRGEDFNASYVAIAPNSLDAHDNAIDVFGAVSVSVTSLAAGRIRRG